MADPPNEDLKAILRLGNILADNLSATLHNGSIRVVNQDIQDFNTLLLKNVPYGRVDPKEVVQGIIEIQSRFDAQRPAAPLYWYFGGKAYQIDKAIRIPYSYRFIDYGGEERSASVFVGFEHAQNCGEHPHPPPNLEANGTDEQVNHLLERLNGAVGNQLSNQTSQIARNVNDYNELIVEQLPCNAAATKVRQRAIGQDSNADWVGKYTYTVEPTGVQYHAGIARDNDADHPFSYTWEDITQDEEKYDQLMHWPFGSQTFRITKAMRIPYKVVVNDGYHEWAKDFAELELLPRDKALEQLEVTKPALFKKVTEAKEKEHQETSLFIAYQGGGAHSR